MDSLLAKLRVALQLDSAAFEQGANRARRQTEEFGSSAEQLGFKIGSMIRTMINAGKALAGAELVVKIKDAVQQSLEYANAISTAAQVSNATAAEFQRVAYAAQTLGVSSEQLGDIYKDVNDKMGEFLATGGGEMKDFFTLIAPKVGVTAEMFRNLSGPEALQLYVKTLERAGVSQQQMTFFMEALANDATKLLPILKDNGAQVKALGDAAADLGLIMDDAMIAKAVDAKTKMGELSTVLQTRLAVFVVENSDKILDLADKFTTLASKALELINTLERLSGSKYIKQIDQVIQPYSDAMFPWIKTLRDASSRVPAAPAAAKPTGPVAGQDGTTSQWTGLWNSMGKASTGSKALSDHASRASSSLGRLHSAARSAKAAVVELPPAIELTAQQLRVLDAGSTAAAASLQKLLGGTALTKEQSKLLTDKMAGLKAELFPEQKALEDYQQNVAIIQLALQKGILTAQQAYDWSVRLGASGQDRKLVVTDWMAGDDLQQRVKDSTDAITAAWEKAGQAANDNAAKQEEAAQRTAQSIEQMGNAIANSLSSLSNAFKSGDTLDIIGALVQTGTSIFSAIKGGGKVPAYADGTSFHPGGLAMVGERGPELVNLPRGSKVYPNGTGPGGMGGAAQITVTPSKYFDVAVDERVGQAAPRIADAGGRLGQMRVARARSRSLTR
ncbi:UNVERIFIED_ORG: hypothetical protein M2348_001065 [Sphingomonas sp. R1F5B]